MPAEMPTILATSGGITAGRRTRFAFTALTDFAVDLSGVTGRSPRICLLATAMGDDKAVLHYLTEAAQASGFTPSHLALFPMPTVEDITAHLLDQDVVWVASDCRAWRAAAALDAFDAEWGNRYPAAIQLWRNAWSEFVPFLDYATPR